MQLVATRTPRELLGDDSPTYFARRNRLQAGIADLVILVEAGSQSGTAHTINFAKVFGRDLVGLRWPGNAGVTADLERDGKRIIDIFEAAGSRPLDAILGAQVERAGEGRSTPSPGPRRRS